MVWLVEFGADFTSFTNKSKKKVFIRTLFDFGLFAGSIRDCRQGWVQRFKSGIPSWPGSLGTAGCVR
jgi:hypothetical protein